MQSDQTEQLSNRMLRHAGPDRLYHWAMAICVLLLMATSLLPVYGVRFEWLLIHWVAGLVLTILVVFHVLRSLIAKNAAEMWLPVGELLITAKATKKELQGMTMEMGVGKYSTAQKLYHLASALVILAAIVTGLVMLLKIDTPWWERDPYLLAQDIWGWVYVIHGLATMCLVTMLLVHVYFAFRPEKRFYTRSMVLGWVTAEEMERHRSGRLHPK